MSGENIMSESQRPTVDELLELIRKEARYLEVEALGLYDENLAVDPVADLPVWADEDYKFPIKDVYHCNEFLVYDDIEFVNNVYRGIFRRAPDESGFDGYVATLREGGEKILRDKDIEKLLKGDECELQSWEKKRLRYKLDQKKLHILLDLMKSEEARQHSVRVRGLRWELWELKLRQRGLYGGRIKKYFNVLKYRFQDDQHDLTLETERRRLLAQRKTEGYLSSQFHLFESMAKRNQQIQSEHSQLTAKIERYRKDLTVAQQGLIAQQRRIDVSLAGESVTSTAAEVSADNAMPLSSDKLDAFYMAFENECRGDEAHIRSQMSVHLDKVANCKAISSETPLLDIGSGRGEWLGLLKEQDVPAKGVDISQVLAGHCGAKGLDVAVCDAVEYLNALPDNSLGAITAIHVIEHLEFDQLFALVEQCQRVLAPGGLLMFETPNPENLLVGSHTFYHDPTHHHPVTPTLIKFLVRYLAFTDVEVERLHPYPAEEKVPGYDPLTDRVNGHLLGPQDYVLVAHKMPVADDVQHGGAQ